MIQVNNGCNFLHDHYTDRFTKRYKRLKNCDSYGM